MLLAASTPKATQLKEGCGSKSACRTLASSAMRVAPCDGVSRMNRRFEMQSGVHYLAGHSSQRAPCDKAPQHRSEVLMRLTSIRR